MKTRNFWLFIVALHIMPAAALAQESERVITAEVVVAAPATEVWQAWSSEAGVRTFFAPAAKVELQPGGAYEMYFAPDAEPGQRGGEGNQVLAVQENRMLSFTWNAPPSLPSVREQRTFVVVRFHELGPAQTRVVLRHYGWGDGGEWDKAFAYFSRAWNSFVMPMLKYRFDKGPVDWNNPPDLSATR